MSIKTLGVKLRKLEDQISQEIIKRENSFETKSETWQESEKGEKYQEDTNALEEAVTLIRESIDYIPEP